MSQDGCKLVSSCLGVTREWPLPVKIQCAAKSLSRFLCGRAELIPNIATVITTKRTFAKIYIGKEGNHSTSKDLTNCRSQKSLVVESFLILSSGSHPSLFDLTCSFTFNTGSQECVKILILRRLVSSMLQCKRSMPDGEEMRQESNWGGGERCPWATDQADRRTGGRCREAMQVFPTRVQCCCPFILTFFP